MISLQPPHALPGRSTKGRPGAEQGFSEGALEKGMEEKSKEFADLESGVYVLTSFSY